MIALGMLLVFVVYVAVALFVAWFLARQFDSQKAKTTAVVSSLLVFALIPTWDILPGRLYFNHLCETEGGLKVYKTVEGWRDFAISREPRLEAKQLRSLVTNSLKRVPAIAVMCGTPSMQTKYVEKKLRCQRLFTQLRSALVICLLISKALKKLF